MNATELLEKHEDLFTLIERDVKTDRYQKLMEQHERGVHPTTEELHDYAFGVLTPIDLTHIQRHIAFCRICAKEVSSIIKVDSGEMPETKLIKKTVQKIINMWQPFAPQPIEVAFAAASHKNEHVFKLEEDGIEIGNVEVECQLKEYDSKPTALYMAWKINIEVERALKIRFINPENPEQIYYTVNIGMMWTGEETFSSEELGFDPSKTLWALSVV